MRVVVIGRARLRRRVRTGRCVGWLGCLARGDARSAPGFPRAVREGRLGCRDISSPTGGRMVRSGHDHQGLNHLPRLRRGCGSHAVRRAGERPSRLWVGQFAKTLRAHRFGRRAPVHGRPRSRVPIRGRRPRTERAHRTSTPIGLLYSGAAHRMRVPNVIGRSQLPRTYRLFGVRARNLNAYYAFLASSPQRVEGRDRCVQGQSSGQCALISRTVARQTSRGHCAPWCRVAQRRARVLEAPASPLLCHPEESPKVRTCRPDRSAPEPGRR